MVVSDCLDPQVDYDTLMLWPDRHAMHSETRLP